MNSQDNILKAPSTLEAEIKLFPSLPYMYFHNSIFLIKYYLWILESCFRNHKNLSVKIWILTYLLPWVPWHCIWCYAVNAQLSVILYCKLSRTTPTSRTLYSITKITSVSPFSSDFSTRQPAFFFFWTGIPNSMESKTEWSLLLSTDK